VNINKEMHPLTLKYDYFDCQPVMEYYFLEDYYNSTPRITRFECTLSKNIRYGENSNYINVKGFGTGKDYAEAFANAEKQFNERVAHIESARLATKPKCEYCGKVL